MASVPVRRPVPRWVKYLAMAAVLSVGVLLLLDKLVMPALVHSQEVVRMPELVGTNIDDARRLLTVDGFTVEKVDTHADERYAAGLIVYQNPYGGAEVKKGRRVFLTVSSGRELLQMPQLAGLPFREAKIRIQMAGLAVGDIDYAASSTAPEETVIAQSMPAGARVGLNAKISLTVSTGPERPLLAMPSLVGRTLAEAQGVLQADRLVFGQITYRKNRDVLPSTVLEQHPAAGDSVREQTPIDLTVAGE